MKASDFILNPSTLSTSHSQWPYPSPAAYLGLLGAKAAYFGYPAVGALASSLGADSYRYFPRQEGSLVPSMLIMAFGDVRAVFLCGVSSSDQAIYLVEKAQQQWGAFGMASDATPVTGLFDAILQAAGGPDDTKAGAAVFRGVYALAQAILTVCGDQFAPGLKYWFAGHSLGGAIAAMLAAFVRLNYGGQSLLGCHMVGNPRPGNSVFAAFLEGRFPGDPGNAGPVVCWQSSRDFVCDLPPTEANWSILSASAVVGSVRLFRLLQPLYVVRFARLSNVSRSSRIEAFQRAVQASEASYIIPYEYSHAGQVFTFDSGSFGNNPVLAGEHRFSPINLTTLTVANMFEQALAPQHPHIIDSYLSKIRPLVNREAQQLIGACELLMNLQIDDEDASVVYPPPVPVPEPWPPPFAFLGSPRPVRGNRSFPPVISGGQEDVVADLAPFAIGTFEQLSDPVFMSAFTEEQLEIMRSNRPFAWQSQTSVARANLEPIAYSFSPRPPRQNPGNLFRGGDRRRLTDLGKALNKMLGDPRFLVSIPDSVVGSMLGIIARTEKLLSARVRAR